MSSKYAPAVPPSIRVTPTVGGYFRVVLHGPDALQPQHDRPRYFEADIARADTRDEALQMACEWFRQLDAAR